MDWLLQPEAWVALLTLTALEIVLGIDNIIFLSILVGRLPPERRQSARVLGLGLAMGSRIALLLSLTWLMSLTAPIVAVLGHEVSWRDVILIGGGAFLLAKATLEIHNSLEGEEEGPKAVQAAAATRMKLRPSAFAPGTAQKTSPGRTSRLSSRSCAPSCTRFASQRATAASTPAWRRSQTTTIAPSRANFSAVARPMPWAAPVMMETLSFKRMVNGRPNRPR